MGRYKRIVEAKKREGTFDEWRKEQNKRVQKSRSEMSSEKKLELSRRKNLIKKQKIAAVSAKNAYHQFFLNKA